MAQIEGSVQGLTIDVSLATKEDLVGDDDAIEEALLNAYRAKKRGHVKAAAAYAVDAINMLNAEHQIGCGASL